MNTLNIRRTTPFKKTCCIVLAALAAMYTIAALTRIDDGRRYIWPITNGGGAHRGKHQVKSRVSGLLQQRLKDVEDEEGFRGRVLREQTRRQQRLARGCSSLVAQKSRRAPTKTILSLVVNVPSPLQITYCAIPKCGTSTWLNFCEDVTRRTCERFEVHDCARVKFKTPLSLENFLPRSLVIVRNPWRRLVSAYVDKFVTERHWLAASCYKRSGKSLHSPVPVTFAEFVSCILAEYRNGRKLDRHYAPQHWQCALCRANYSFIAKMETFAEDFRYLATQVFLKRDYKAYLAAISNVRRRRIELRNASSVLYEDCYRSLKPAAMTALLSLYRRDAELFGYSLHPLF